MELSYASLVCSMLVQQCFTGVDGTRFQPDIFGNPFKSEHYSLAFVTVMAEIDVFVSSTDNFNIVVVTFSTDGA